MKAEELNKLTAALAPVLKDPPNAEVQLLVFNGTSGAFGVLPLFGVAVIGGGDSIALLGGSLTQGTTPPPAPHPEAMPSSLRR